MEYIQIPLKLIESAEFNALPWGNKEFTLALYRRFNDTDRFTIDLDKPTEYYQSPQNNKNTMSKRVWDLVQAGIIIIDSYRPTRRYGKQRVFKFKDWS